MSEPSPPPRKALLVIDEERIAPRFDLATEIVLAGFGADGSIASQRTVVLGQASAEDLCHLVVSEGADVVVCNGIEDEFHQYLGWKRVRVIDSVIGAWREALRRVGRGELEPVTNLDRGEGATR